MKSGFPDLYGSFIRLLGLALRGRRLGAAVEVDPSDHGRHERSP
jgi:hypothetical protein